MWALLVPIDNCLCPEKSFQFYAVGFYNQENLFDTCHDVERMITTSSLVVPYKWDGLKYSHKLHNMAQALSEIGTDAAQCGMRHDRHERGGKRQSAQ